MHNVNSEKFFTSVHVQVLQSLSSFIIFAKPDAGFWTYIYCDDMIPSLSAHKNRVCTLWLYVQTEFFRTFLHYTCYCSLYRLFVKRQANQTIK